MGNQEILFNIPGYRIDRILGKGGMATVYLGTQMSLGRPVALKILNDPETPQFFERFFNEGRYVARLSHSNLVTIFDIGQGDGFYYIVMEYLPGGDLKSRIAGGIKPGPALKILARLANCLGYVHGKGVIHRDIKPSNILFRADGTPVLTDFGIAKLIQADNDLTVTGTVMGSPHYLSPEQAQGSRKLDGRADLYSLGIILYEMLTGRKPYSADGFAAVLMAHIKQPVPRLPEPLQGLQPLVDRLLAKEPEDRFQSGAEVVKGIKQVRHAASPHPTPTAITPTPAAGAGRPGATALSFLRPAVGVIAAGLLVTAVVDYSWRDGPAPAAAPQAEQEVQAAVDPAPTVTSNNAAGLIPGNPLTTNETGKSGDSGGTTGNLIAAIDNGEDLPLDPPGNEDGTLLDSPVVANEAPPIEAWLLMAEQRYQANRLGVPRGDSARDWYQRVLAQEPDNADASTGLKRIASRYTQLARNRMQEEELEKARRFIRRGLKTLPGEPALTALSKQLTALEQAQQRRQAAPPVQPPSPVIKRPTPMVKPEPDPFAALNPGDH